MKIGGEYEKFHIHIPGSTGSGDSPAAACSRILTGLADGSLLPGFTFYFQYLNVMINLWQS
jgi:hypothetical protein